MRTTHLLLLAACCIMLTAHANAQTKPNPNADFKKAVKDLGVLFKRKKDTTATAGGGQATTPATGTVTGTPTIVKTGGNYTIISNAGEVAPGAKTIDAETLSNFNNGAAVVRKGSASGLIDANGNFIIPYNTYMLTEAWPVHTEGWRICHDGFFRFTLLNSYPGGYVNAAGKIIVQQSKYPSNTLFDLSENKHLVVGNFSTRNASAYAYFLPDGRSYTSGDLIENIVDGIGIVRITKGQGWAYVYKKLTGEAISAAYDDAAPFAEGMARVGIKDAFGVLKYGFINTQGKLVIPCMFTEVPTDFYGGFARVTPKDKTEFEYAFINKAGTIVFKQTLAEATKYGRFDHFTSYGLAFSFTYVLDTNFTLTPKGAFFKSFGLPEDSWFEPAGTYAPNENNPKLIFSTRLARGKYTQMPVYGFINLATRKVVMPVFDFINMNGMYFDPASHLAWAKVCTGRDNKNVPIYREGYINEDGMFVMVKAAGSTW